jgi:diadenosine tetraphosphatase ApaH/serine/threonine PP2A family protein phosphatase
MRYLVLSDLHSNLEALETALAYAGGLGYESILVLGDVVGYGPDPNAVVDSLRRRGDVVAIRGNHDKVAAGLEEGEGFNEAARKAAHWTRDSLTPENLAYLRALPKGPREFAPGGLLVHGTPHDEDRYLLDEGEARRSFQAAAFELCFFGHTHYPGAFTLAGGRVTARRAQGDQTVFALAAGQRCLLNPGSLGQPRDRDPRCAFALYDADARSVAVHRIPYPLEATREKIRAAGLPAALGERLRFGV